MTNILKKLKGKHIVLNAFCVIGEGNNLEGEVCILNCFDDNFIEIEKCTKLRMVIPFDKILYIELADEENIEKFEDYIRKFELDPYFEGDRKPSYFIKRIKKVNT